MNHNIERLIQDYFPNDKTNAEQMLTVFSYGIISELEKYAESQYRKYTMSSSKSIKNDPWVLGTSEGADKCIELIKKLLDEK